MSTNRELLEMAAKAAGLAVLGEDHGDLLISSDGCRTGYHWNPLADDGDALRLVAALKIDIEWQATRLGAESGVEAYRTEIDEAGFCASEHQDNYRRAIVRAAAEIGRRMP